MEVYRAAVIGCSRMGGFIDNEVARDRSIVLPYSHAAGFAACPRTELVACSDLRPEVMAAFGRQYGVPPERQYLDYRQLLERERPEFVSIATQPEHRAAILLHAVEQGGRAIYAEKALCASMAEAEAIVEAVERRRVAFNMGTNRRWDPGFAKMRAVIESGELGRLKTLVAYGTGALFNTGSHAFDTLFWLNGDAPVSWVQGHLRGSDAVLDGDVLPVDPVGQGLVAFANGVTGVFLDSPRGSEYEAICERGTIASLNNGLEWQARRREGNAFVAAPFPAFEPASPTLRLIEDLVQALDTGQPTRGGVRVARANMELIFAFIASHQTGGARIDLPLRDGRLRLTRNREPNQPRFAA